MIRAHVLCCGGTGCTSSGSLKIQDAFIREIEKQGLAEEVKYFVGYMNYLNYLNSLSDNDIQSAAENRANVLYAHMKYNEQRKIENKPLKMIAEELKQHNL